ENLCRRAGLLGRELDGSLAEHVVLPERYLHPVPAEIGLEAATLIETLATVHHAQSRVSISPGDAVVVLGQGATGLLHTQLAKLAGASPVVAISRSAWKRDLARRMRADATVDPAGRDIVAEVLALTVGRGADVVIDTTGAPGLLRPAMEMLRPGGTFLLYAISHEPVPEGVCRTADAYRSQLALAGLAETARRVAGAERLEARRPALSIRLGLTRTALDPEVTAALDSAWKRLTSGASAQLAVRSSASCEDTVPASFAGQFETFLGIAEPADLVTAVRACWTALWSTRALRYMSAYEIDPAQSAMPILIQ